MQGMPVGRNSGVSLLRILAGVFLLAVLVVYSISHANFVLGRSLLLAFPGWEVTYRSAWPLPGGGAIARDVKLVSPEGEQAGTFTFAKLRVEVPFLQYYRSGFSRRRDSLLNSISDVRLAFSSGHGDLDYPFSRELALFGVVSAAPFETEGCLTDSAWVENELSDMGLSPGGTDLVMEYHAAAAGLVKQQVLHTAGVGQVEFRREMIRHDDFSLFSLVESGRSEVANDEWHIRDEGFVAARNNHCAAKDKVTLEAFVQRHVDSAKRMLEAVGLAPLPEFEQAYRGYAAKGGRFDIALRYDPPIGAPLYGADDMGSWVPRIRGSVAFEGKSLALGLTSTPVRPLPDSDESGSTYALVLREAGGAAARDAAAPGRSDAGPAASPAATGAQRAATVPLAANGAPAPPAPVAATSAPVEPSRQEPVESEARGSAPVEAAALTKYGQLAGYVGRNLTVYVQGREPARVQILRVGDGGSILVRRSMAGGNVEYVLDRTRFDHAEE